MRNVTTLGAAAVGIALQVFAGTAAAAPEGAAIAAKYNCTACHAQDHKLVGPAYNDIAKKYAGDASAPAKLAAKVKAGGSGVWGAIPMPPNNLPDADLQKVVAWILSPG